MNTRCVLILKIHTLYIIANVRIHLYGCDRFCAILNFYVLFLYIHDFLFSGAHGFI